MEAQLLLLIREEVVEFISDLERLLGGELEVSFPAGLIFDVELVRAALASSRDTGECFRLERSGHHSCLILGLVQALTPDAGVGIRSA